MKKHQRTTNVETAANERQKQFSSAFGPKANEYLRQGLTFDEAKYQFAIFERDQLQEQCNKLQKQIELTLKQLKALK